MTTQATTQQAEQLWIDAHENARRGDLATAVRQLAACYEILLALGDPRLREVHQRWTEVHRLYADEAARAAAATTPVETTVDTAATTVEATEATEATAAADVSDAASVAVVDDGAAATASADLAVHDDAAAATASADVAVIDDAGAAAATEAADVAVVEDAGLDAHASVATVATVDSVVTETAGVDVAAFADGAPGDEGVAANEAFATALGVPLDASTSSIADSSAHAADGLEAIDTAGVGAGAEAAPAFAPSTTEHVAGADVVDALTTAIATSADIHEQATLVPMPTSTEAPPMTPSDAPVGLVSLEIEIDFVDGGGSTPPSVAPAPVAPPVTATAVAEDDFGDVATELAASAAAPPAPAVDAHAFASSLDFGLSSPVPATTEPPSIVLDPTIDALPAVAAATLDVAPLAASLDSPPPLGAEPLDAAPLDAAPLDAEPLDAAPLDAEPIDAAPLDAAPLDAAPLDAAPLDAAPLDAAPTFVGVDSVAVAAPVDGAASAAPAPGDDVGFLEDLLERVRANRRAA